jgi:hypothetical protein
MNLMALDNISLDKILVVFTCEGTLREEEVVEITIILTHKETRIIIISTKV